MPHKVAFCTVPHIGGIYSVYQKLRNSISNFGWEVYGVQVGTELSRWEYRKDLMDSGIRRIVQEETNLKKAAQAFCAWVESEQIEIVMPMSSPAAMAAVPHLPPHVKVVTRCISANIQAYRLAALNHTRLSRIVITSPRQRTEIVKRFRVAENKLCHIPNAVDPSVFNCDGSLRGSKKGIAVIYVGRLINIPKNIFALPKICDCLAAKRVPFKLSVIGAGPDARLLRQQLASHEKLRTVEFLGPRSHEEIISFFSKSDCIILPSEEEGFPNVLIEAMACRVVPVVSRLAGITDWIVADGLNGKLCPFDQPDSFAIAISDLHHSPEKRRIIGEAARNTVVQRFSIDRFADNWNNLFADVIVEGDRHSEPRSWDEFKPNPAFQKSRYRWLPRKARNSLRSILDGAGIRTR